MAVVDRASFLIDTMASRLRPIRDGLLLVGLYYSTKWTCKTLLSLYKGFKTYGLPRIWPRNFVEEYGQWAIVTGASKGIGKSYAYELAKRGLNLVLIARSQGLLMEISKDIEDKYQVTVEIIVGDMSQEDILRKIKEGVKGKDIGILVNNAGINLQPMVLTNMDQDRIQQMIMVNVYAVTTLTKMILPGLVAKKKGAIVNVSSVASLVPHGLLSVYSATKAFVTCFSRGLQQEYASKNITIQCLVPGAVNTDMLTMIDNDQVAPGIPSPDAYAACAIRTLGFSNYTCGYWSHSLQSILFLEQVSPYIIFLMVKMLTTKTKEE